MRWTVEIDESLLAAARELTDIQETRTLADETLRALIERECMRELAVLGATEPNLKVPSRRR